MQDDPNDPLLGEEPSAEDFAPSAAKDQGPLGQRPEPDLALPAIAIYACFAAISMAYWAGKLRNVLPVNRNAIFQDHEYGRALTALATHADVGHLLANGPLFLVFGWLLYAYFGFWVFPALTFLLGFATNIATVYFMPETTNLIGASGMLYAMVALWIIFYVRYDIRYRISTRIFRAIGVSLLLLFPTAFFPNVSYLSHALGFAIGLGMGLILLPVVKVYDPRVKNDLQKP